MSENRLFTSEELTKLTTPLPDQIIKCIKNKKLDEALSLNEEMKKTRIILHDYFADSCTVLWSWVGDNLGEDMVEDMFRYIFDQSAKRQVYNTAGLNRIYPRLTTGLIAATAWRSHSCFGYGEHPAKFKMTEDEEKFTFHMHPCASGARLWLRGMYEPGRGGKLTEKAHGWSFNRKDFPYYCIHSAFLNEILPYEEFGYLMWPTDEPKGPEDVCRWHVYKDPNNIPDKYYERHGFKKNKIDPVPAKNEKKIYYSEDELKEIVRPMTDRIREKIMENNLDDAVNLCREVRYEFLFLHDLYMNMILSTYTFISEKSGESKLGDALDFQFEKCLKPILEEKTSLSPREKIKFFALKIFGVDNCNQTGFPKGKFTVTETAEDIIFKLDPCGSGGRLLRGGAYKPMSPWRKFKEELFDSLTIKINNVFTIPESMMMSNYEKTGGYVTQRKAYAQGKTCNEHSWSFGKKETPYYCCQCGMLQDKSGKSYLKISPPEKDGSPCIWKIKKSNLGEL